MNAELQTQIAFHLAGRKAEAGAESADARPALLARYRDLSALRYDFPLVLLRKPGERDYVRCLSGVVDEVVHGLADGDGGERLTRHLLRLEREIRVLLAGGARGSLSTLWDDAAGRLAGGDESLQDSLRRGRRALKLDGDLVDCDESLPTLLLKHAWGVVRERKTRKLGEDLRRLAIGLSNILQADAARSEAGRSPDSLKASIGTGHAEVFDFAAMSRLLAKASPKDGLPAGRRRRIESLLSVLQAQRFVPVPGEAQAQDRCYAFTFGSCAEALAAYRERLPKAIELARSIAVAELEVKGEYREAAHDALFKDFAEGGLGQEELAYFPDYLICMSADALQGAETDRLMELLSAGLPVKILVQTDDLLEESTIARDGHFALGMRSKQLANMALGLNDVYVLQSSSSNLFQFRDRILAGMSYTGPALFSVYSGAAGGNASLPPYLLAAAAMESRAFPAYCYDPGAGANWASRFYLEANSQVEADWPTQEFSYEDENHQRVRATPAFTFVDFVACDPRHARHFARVPRAQWNDKMVPIEQTLRRGATAAGDSVPYIMLVDGEHILQRAIVDERLLRAALRCRESWHSLQELGGIHNSHAERLLARQTAAPAPQPAPEAPVQASAATEETPVAVAEETKSSDDPYIETPRCTTCNECTQINDKMFAYNENKQAYVADPDAGTYAQLVEAAESCQVSIIHPGKPRNPAEPGLAELLVRAEPFA